jgi:hypothetical protein
MPGCNQAFHQMRADKPIRAGNQNVFHIKPFPKTALYNALPAPQQPFPRGGGGLTLIVVFQMVVDFQKWFMRWLFIIMDVCQIDE